VTLARLVTAPLAALGLAVLVVTFTPVVPWYARTLAGIWDKPEGEVLIVLGAGSIDATTLDPGSYWRAVYAARTWRGGGFRELVVSGKGVAPLIQDFLVSHGVPAAVIRLEEQSTSTHENALNIARMLTAAPGRKVLVTSDYHMFRARRAFARAGLAVRACPFPDVLKQSNRLTARWDCFLTLGLETGKIVYYRVRGWI
jgi:uncharacterized SAM-binding protein YcdF (DUF218 family)